MTGKVANIKTVAGVQGTIGDNIHTRVDGDTLTITIDLSKDFGKSASGKTNIIAASRGNVPVPGALNGAVIGLNVYRK